MYRWKPPKMVHFLHGSAGRKPQKAAIPTPAVGANAAFAALRQ